MTDPRLASLERVEAERDALRRDATALRALLDEARSRIVTFAAMVEDVLPFDPDHAVGLGRLTVQLRDHLTNVVVTNVVLLPYSRIRDWPDADSYLEDMLTHTADVVAREYSYAIAGASR